MDSALLEHPLLDFKAQPVLLTLKNNFEFGQMLTNRVLQ